MKEVKLGCEPPAIIQIGQDQINFGLPTEVELNELFTFHQGRKMTMRQLHQAMAAGARELTAIEISGQNETLSVMFSILAESDCPVASLIHPKATGTLREKLALFESPEFADYYHRCSLEVIELGLDVGEGFTRLHQMKTVLFHIPSERVYRYGTHLLLAVGLGEERIKQKIAGKALGMQPGQAKRLEFASSFDAVSSLAMAPGFISLVVHPNLIERPEFRGVFFTQSLAALARQAPQSCIEMPITFRSSAISRTGDLIRASRQALLRVGLEEGKIAGL
jgi:hypothetical protein